MNVLRCMTSPKFPAGAPETFSMEQLDGVRLQPCGWILSQFPVVPADCCLLTVASSSTDSSESVLISSHLLCVLILIYSLSFFT